MKRVVTTKPEIINATDVNSCQIIASKGLDPLGSQVISQVVYIKTLNSYSLVRIGSINGLAYETHSSIERLINYYNKYFFYTFDDRDEFYKWLKEQL